MTGGQNVPLLNKDTPVRIKLPTPDTYLLIHYVSIGAPDTPARGAPQPARQEKGADSDSDSDSLTKRLETRAVDRSYSKDPDLVARQPA